MAHPQHYPPQQAYSPPISTASPATAPSPNYFPPPKRQRISPNPQSPYGSPSLSTLQLPNAGPLHINGIMANGTQTPMGPPPVGSMGPPSRPNEKATDMTEIADVLTSSGIDLREEEAQLLNPLIPSTTYQNNLANSFNSQGSSFGTLSASNSFSEQLPSRMPGSQATFYGAGPLNQPSLSLKTAEELLGEEKKKSARRQSERQQYHLNAPFLQEGTVNYKLLNAGHNSQVHIARPGLVVPTGNSPAAAEMAGPDGSSIIATKGSALIMRHDSPLADMLALLSLACEERVRGIMEQSVALAKQRRLHSHGVVPPEWSDLALDDGANVTMALTARSGVESAVSPMTAPALKRSFSASQLASTSVDRPLHLSNFVIEVLRKQARAEKVGEERRTQKRARLAQDAFTAGEGGARTPSVSTPGGPGTPGLVAPDSGIKTSKKELRKAAEAKATEAQQHAHANETARMALGGAGKKYAWMNKGSGTSTPNTGFGPNRINTAVNNGNPGTPSGGGGSAGLAQNDGSKRFGEWREDREKGHQIQVRDVLQVLDLDRRASVAVQRAYVKMRPSGQEG